MNEKKISKHLPNVPPKKSGKRGINPLDFDEDFSKPVTRQTPMGPLSVAQPNVPAIANGRMQIYYDRPIFSRVKDHILVALQCSVPIEEGHADLLPKIIEDARKDVLKKGRTRINMNGSLPAQHAALYLSSDIDEELVTLAACKLVNVNVALIERKGEGTARTVVRLSFRLQAEFSRPLATFAEANLQNDFWLTLKDSQEPLWDEDSEDA